MRVTLLLALSMSGCSGIGSGTDGFSVSDQACEHNFLSWSGGLTFHMLEGGASDGSFDYVPRGEVGTRTAGSYDLVTGDFDWSEEYHPDHYLTGRTVSGYGYANTNGDLDLVGTRVATDIAGETFTSIFREVRLGCDVSGKSRPEGGTEAEETYHEGAFSADTYTYSTIGQYDDGTLRVIDGTEHSDLTYTMSEATTFADGTSWNWDEAGDRATGVSRRDWEQLGDPDADFAGYDDEYLNGDRHRFYNIIENGSASATWDYTVNYFGTGSGTYTVLASGDTCSLTYTEWACTFDCGGSNTGDC
jgi:hypothetical protein